MGIARERTVPRPPQRAWLKFACLAAAIGVAFGVALPPATKWAIERTVLTSQTWSSVYLTIYIGLFLLLLLPLALLFRVTQRWSVCLAFAASFVTSLTLAAEAISILSRGDGGADILAWLDLEAAVVALAFIAGYVVLASLVRLAYRLVIIRTTEHTEGLCPWCGYSLGAESIIRCPECGRLAHPPRYRLHTPVMSIMAIASRWKTCLLVAVGLLAFFARAPLINKTLPSARFYHAFPNALRIGRYNPGSYILPDLPSVWIPHPTLNDRGLRITYEPATRGRAVHMSIDVTGTPATSYSYGAGHVITDLDADRSAWVIRNGLPQGLVNALYAKADEIAWTPTSVARGAWEVDATPFIPK